MGDHVDLAALAALLPDTLKRKIINTIEPAPEQEHEPQLQQEQSATGSDGLINSICSRAVHLPSLAAGACVLDRVLSQAEAKHVAMAVEAWLARHGHRPGMGAKGSGGLWHDPSYRGDVISWVTQHELQEGGQPVLAAVLQLLTSLKQKLMRQGFDVSGRCSIQLACYPGGGARYVRHTDASDAVPGRTVTALLYLNTDWDVQRDGGQLVLYDAVPHSSSCQDSDSGATACTAAGTAANASEGCEPPAGYLHGEPALLVAPLAGRLLVFNSRLPHEVLPAQRHRYSITAFFYRGKQEEPAAETAAGAEAAAAAPLVTAGIATDTVLQAHAAAPEAAPRQAAGPEAAACQSVAEVMVGAASAADHCSACDAGERSQTCSASAGPLPRIFVSIAAFRDEECQWTLRDLFIKAAQPQRVFVGVVWQVDPQADHAFTRMAGGGRTAQFQQQVRELRLHYRTATGPCLARSLAQQLWAGEEYVLQIDAHMRFVQDWDNLCLQQLCQAQQAAGSEREVLSTYPLGYSGQGPAAVLPEQAPATLLCAKEFDASGLLRIQSRSLKHDPPGPLPSYFWAAGFSFAPAAWLLEVPYCPHLPHLFFGEESYMLARMVTRGWQVWAPGRALLFHQWERSERSRSYQACVQVDMQARTASQAKVLDLFKHGGHSHSLVTGAAAAQRQNAAAAAAAVVAWHAASKPSDADWTPGGVWGLGTVVTLQQFEDMCGVCFEDKFITDRARSGGQGPTIFVE